MTAINFHFEANGDLLLTIMIFSDHEIYYNRLSYSDTYVWLNCSDRKLLSKIAEILRLRLSIFILYIQFTILKHPKTMA